MNLLTLIVINSNHRYRLYILGFLCSGHVMNVGLWLLTNVDAICENINECLFIVTPGSKRVLNWYL